MEYVELAPGLKLSRIVQGCYLFSKYNTPVDVVKRQFKACLESGVTSFDTAEVYGDGHNEELLAEAFGALGVNRADIQIVSKTGIVKKIVDGKEQNYYDTSYKNIVSACKSSLQRLKTDYLDLYLIHRESPMIDYHETTAALIELKKQGLIRAFGVSNFDPFKFAALSNLAGGEVCTNQIEWNPCCFEHFDSGMMDVLVEKQVHPMFWSPLLRGKIFTDEQPMFARVNAVLTELSEKYGAPKDTVVYAWLLMHPSRGLPISGSSKPERLGNAIAALDLELELADWFRLYTASGQQVTR